MTALLLPYDHYFSTMRVLSFILICLLFGSGLSQTQEDYGFDDQEHISTTLLAAQLTRIASRLARAAPRVQGRPRQHKREQAAACVCPKRVDSAVDNVNKGNVRSVPVGFKGHNLTVVALANE